MQDLLGFMGFLSSLVDPSPPVGTIEVRSQERRGTCVLFEIPLVVEPTMEKSMSALENRFSSRADYVQSLVELKQTHVVCFLGPFDRAGPLSRTLTFNHHSIVKVKKSLSCCLFLCSVHPPTCGSV